MRAGPLKTSSNASAMTADNTFSTTALYRGIASPDGGHQRRGDDILPLSSEEENCSVKPPFLNVKYLSEVEESIQRMEVKHHPKC